MSPNLGAFDRLLRLFLGVVLIALPLSSQFEVLNAGMPRYAVFAVGAIMLATSVTRFCPLYRLFGVRTCSID